MKSQSNSANEKLIRSLYAVAETKNSKAFANLFTKDGYFYDVSAGVKYYGTDLGKTVDIYATAFPDMHRELIEFYVKDDEHLVVVELTLNGTHKGPLALPVGTIPPTGKVIIASICRAMPPRKGQSLSRKSGGIKARRSFVLKTQWK